MTFNYFASRKLVKLLLSSFIMLLLSVTLHAQGTGKIVGKIKEASSSTTLAGANLLLLNTSMGAGSDLQGNYTISRVPEGTYQLRASFLGYEEKIVEVKVEANKTVSVNFELEETATLLEGVIVYGKLTRGQAKSLNEQKNATNIKNVVSAEQFQLFPDRNAAETVARIPGISIDYDQGEGEMVQIRGIGPEYNSLTVNGQRIPAPAAGDGRAVGLDLLNQDLMENIEVTKALTPDIDGDAIGGNINFQMKQAPDETTFAVNVSGGINNQESAYNTYGKDIQDYSAYFGKRFFDNKLGILVAGSYYKTNRGSMIREWEYDDVTTGIIFAQHSNDYDVLRERSGININTEYKFDEFNRIYFNYSYNRYLDKEIRRLHEWIIEDEEETKETRNRVEDQYLNSLVFGGKHNINGIKLDYTASWMKAEEDMPARTYFRYQRDFDYSEYSNEDVKNFDVNSAFDSQAEVLTLNRIRVDDKLKKDEDKSATLNIEIPYNLFSQSNTVKFGGKYLKKDVSYEGRRLQLKKFSEDYTITGSQFGNEDVIVDPNDTDYLGAKKSEYLESTLDDNYDATENVIAAYGMTTVHFNNYLSLLGGVRFEHTNNKYKTLAVTSEIKDQSDASYSNILPSLHLTYRFNDNTNIRAAYSTGIARPDYSDLVPVEFRDDDGRKISYGNPDLEPTTSNNFDLLFEKYTNFLGYFSAGLFYKDMSKIIVTSKYNKDIEYEGDTQTYEINKPINSDEGAYAYGLEVALNQKLNFLGVNFLKHFNVYTNYTYTKARMTVDKREIPLSSSPEHIVNFALMYDNTDLGLSFVISNSFRGEILKNVGKDKYHDTYYGSEYHLDFSVTQKITSNLTATLQLNNLTNQYEQQYYGDPSESYSKDQQWAKYGSYGTLGLLYEL